MLTIVLHSNAASVKIKIRTCSIVLQTPQLYINTNTIIIIYMFVASRIIKREYEYLFFVDGQKFLH